MNLLDRYIIRRFVAILFFSLIAFMAVFIIVNLVEQLDSFIKHEVPAGIVVKMYIYQLPYIFTLTLPVAMLLSSLFSIGNMSKQNELTAMKASGISLYRMLSPLFLLSILISIATFGFSEVVVPPASDRYGYLKDQYMDRFQNRWRKLVKNPFVRDQQGRLINMRDFNAATNTGHTVSIRSFRDQSLIRRVDAKKIIWQDSIWVLHSGYIRTFENAVETAIPFKRHIFSDTDLVPADFDNLFKKPEAMSFWELEDFIEEVRRNGGDPDRWLVDLYLKFAMPFSNFIIVLFGAPLSARKQRESAATGFGLSLAIVFTYFGILKTTQAMGQSGILPPLVAAWVANIIFGIAGLIALLKASK